MPQHDGPDHPAPTAARPRITEIKRTLAGREKRFDCTVLRRAGSHLIVLFVAPSAMHVHGIDLPAGTITLGHFWTDRPYNVYHWLERDSGATIGCYLNVADDTSFSGDLLTWRDLVVDILIAPDGAATVLDEDELPADLAPPLRAYIDAACATVMAGRAPLLAELEHHRHALWPSVRGATPGEASP